MTRPKGTEAEAEVPARSKRLEFLFPAESRDEAVFSLYNDEETMLPYLPSLCPISAEALKERRQRHRAQYLEGESMFWDVVMPAKTAEEGEEGEEMKTKMVFVGTSGFRAINRQKGEVEWGIAICKQFQRKGLCREAFQAAVQYARKHLVGILSLRASTLARNQPMVLFLLKEGLVKTGSHKDDDEEWDDYVMSL